MKVKTTILAALAALTLAAPAVAHEADDYGNAYCGLGYGPISLPSQYTGHSWIDVWTGQQVPVGGGTGNGWYRLYAHAYTAGGYDGWHLAYYSWRHCY
jgi:hypothetical protein